MTDLYVSAVYIAARYPAVRCFDIMAVQSDLQSFPLRSSTKVSNECQGRSQLGGYFGATSAAIQANRLISPTCWEHNFLQARSVGLILVF